MTHVTHDESTTDTDIIDEVMGYDKWPDGVATAFERALGDAVRAYLKNRKNLKNDFASIAANFGVIETEFLTRVGDDEGNVQQVRRIVTEFLLQAAWVTDQPFETCQRYWHELQKLGFYHIERESMKTSFFAALCLNYGQIDLGLAVVDPFVAKLERLRAEPNLTESAVEYYDQEIESLQKLRARLEAARSE